MRRGLGILLLAVAVVGAGCGRKAPPQPLAPAAPPAIAELHHAVNGPVLMLDFRLQGGAGGIGYQIDRAEIDPVCRCPTMWRRYFEQPPQPRDGPRAVHKPIPLKTTETEFLFRVRAVDLEGRFGPWSETIRARAVDLSK
ncbi:MAG: hypothetical protein R8K47_07850 [Mariprofundaceae bacterium]